jgi:lipopolysaccharide/colanic/teichoic acid biosynthesis glycosyltransferase
MISYMYGPKYYLGQTRGLKGHEDFIDALAVCIRSRPNLVGIVVGGAWGGAHAYERHIRDYGKRRLGDRIHFLGTRSDIPDLYADFDVVAHPSLSENVGGAAESLMLGVPTITTNLGGFPDLIEPSKTGWLVPPRDPTRLATAILDALDDPARAREMAAEGQVRARNLLDVTQNAREIAEIYHQVQLCDAPRHSRSQTMSVTARTDEPTSCEIRLTERDRGPFYPLAKRMMDIAGSVTGLCVFAPLMALIALTLRVAQGRSILFAQVRPGLNGRPFRLYKFRTMRESFDAIGDPLSDAERLTLIGRFLRKTSLDELPQLWNVLKGDLSLVGPRPLLMDYLTLYSAEQRRRHEVKPGMTGWAQVNGRNALAWEDKFRLDVWYVDHRSLRLDLKILAMTVRKVATGAGVSGGPQVATVHPFRGSSTGELA